MTSIERKEARYQRRKAARIAAKLAKYGEFDNYETVFMELMETAEKKFEEGAERKEWVLAMLKASADGINYDIDYNAIADMIDRLCDMSNIINAAIPKQDENTEE